MVGRHGNKGQAWWNEQEAKCISSLYRYPIGGDLWGGLGAVALLEKKIHH